MLRGPGVDIWVRLGHLLVAVFVVKFGCVCQLWLMCQLWLFVSLDLGLFYDREEGAFIALGACCRHVGTFGSLVSSFTGSSVTCLLLYLSVLAACINCGGLCQI